MAWTFILTDLNGNVHGEIRNATERKVSIPHLRIPTATFKVPVWHEMADLIMDSDTLLRAYRTDPATGTKTLPFHGPILSPEENSDSSSQTIAVTAAGPYWKMTKRLLGKIKSGISFGSQDLGLTAHQMLATTNGEDFTGISVGTRTASITGSYGPVWLKPVAEAIAELGAGLSSFEVEVVPTDPVNVGGVHGWPQIGVMNLAPIIGVNRPDVIFEYGTGSRNITSYNRKKDREGILNRAVLSLSGWPDAPEQGKDLRIRENTASILARGLFEEVVADNGVIDDGLRDGIGDFHVVLRKDPRVVITFKPAFGITPSPLIDYKVGDTVRGRAVVRGSLRFDGFFRIWGLTFSIDENGNEDLELELVIPS